MPALSLPIPGRRVLAALAALGLAVSFTACTGLASGATGSGASAGSKLSAGAVMRGESALSRKAEAEQLIAQIAEAVSPGAVVVPTDAGATLGPEKCSDPVPDLVYYTISREFNAPAGTSGADLVPQVIEQFHAHGFTTHDVNDHVDYISVLGETNFIGFNLLAYHKDSIVIINMDTECGTPGGASDAPTPPV